MDFLAVLDQVVDQLRQRGRLTYRTLKRQFQLDDEALEDLKLELIEGQRLATDENNTVLVWSGEAGTAQAPTSAPSTPEPVAPPTTAQERAPLAYTPQHLAEKILTSRSALEGERKQVTVLFCDLQNSTPLAAKLGPEAMHTLLNRFFELALDQIHRFEGTVNQFLGDGFMALFGAPLSLEDHARRAVLAAFSLQRSLKDHHAELGEPYGVECAFRMGLNTGLVVVGGIGDNLRMDYTAVGDTTNLAARLQQQAQPGDILVSNPTARLVQGAIRLESLAPADIKGMTEPVPLFKVIGPLPRRSPVVSRSERTLSPFVGRERELAHLHELLGQVENSQGQVVGIVAEAGGGKSRLLYEFRQQLEGHQVTYLEGRCLSYGRSIPYHPIVDLVHNNCGITETDSPDVMAEKLHFALHEIGMDGETSAPYLLQLLGVKEGTESIALLTPEAIRHRIFDTLKQMSLHGAQRRALIFEIEDLHWCDRTSEDYLAFLVESLPAASIMLLTTYRPGYRPSWLGKSYATQISLHSLAPRDALTVVHSTRQHAAFPEHLQQAIVEKAEGNPFFLEELTRAVVEQSDLQTNTAVPDTIQGVLSARIDRLPEGHKHLLQTASVLGREFSPRLLQAIWDGTEPVEALLAELKHLEFLYERTGVLEPVYVFKHALTQQVGYESLLTTNRQRLHAAAGQVLETWYADRLDDAYDRLAYHYANTDDATKAVEYLSLMAEKAAQGYAHAEAVTTLQEALVHAKRLPPEGRDRRIVELGLRLTHSLYFLGRFAETLELLHQQRDRLDQVKDPVLTGAYYFWLSHTYSYLGEHEQAVENAQHAINEAQRGGDQATMGKAYYVLARVGFLSSSYPQGIEHGQQAVALLKRGEEPWWLGQSHWIVGINAIFLGDFAAVLEAEAQAKSIGDAIGDPRLQCYAAWTTGWANATRGEWDAGISDCERGLDHAPDPLSTAVAMGFLGSAYLEAGDIARAISMLEPAVEHMDQFRVRFLQGWYTTWLGEAYLLHQQIEQARARAQHGLEITKDIKNWWGMGCAQRTLGRIAKANGTAVEADMYLHEALDTFSSIHSRFELARIHLDLASLAFSQGHQDSATEHLSTACAWFSQLQVPKYIERTKQIAQEYGVILTQVSLDELGE